MIEERQKAVPGPSGKSVSEELDSLNAALRQKGAQATRRQLEANIEAKARRRRESGKPASAGFKKP